MQISDYTPAILTRLGEYFKKHATPEMAANAKVVSTVAAVQLGVAAIMFYLFKKMREIDEKNPKKEDISRESLAQCTCAVISPGATSVAQQAKLMTRGFVSFRDGLSRRNVRQMATGAALITGTYIVTTNIFTKRKGIIESFLTKS